LTADDAAAAGPASAADGATGGAAAGAEAERAAVQQQPPSSSPPPLPVVDDEAGEFAVPTLALEALSLAERASLCTFAEDTQRRAAERVRITAERRLRTAGER